MALGSQLCNSVWHVLTLNAFITAACVSIAIYYPSLGAILRSVDKEAGRRPPLHRGCRPRISHVPIFSRADTRAPSVGWHMFLCCPALCSWSERDDMVCRRTRERGGNWCAGRGPTAMPNVSFTGPPSFPGTLTIWHRLVHYTIMGIGLANLVGQFLV